MNDCLIGKKNDKGYRGENIYLSLLFLSGPDTFFHSAIRAFVFVFYGDSSIQKTVNSLKLHIASSAVIYVLILFSKPR